MLRNLIVLFLALVLSAVPAEATTPTHPYARTELFTPNIIAISLAVLGFAVGGAVGTHRKE